MKKLFILGIALSLFISCAKEDNAGIPPVNQGQTPQQKDLSILEASTAKAYTKAKAIWYLELFLIILNLSNLQTS